ncbi:MAG: acyl-CoA dehydratase activase [Desulfomonilaceae bacterium]|nr:acyl-CoA dehydratase activase [Desulfomonilaceae bacterium]
MLAAGIDIGSRTIKLVVLDSDADRTVTFRKSETTYNPLDECLRILDGSRWDLLIATGYGRGLVQKRLGCGTITEIQAHALGAHKLFPEVRSVLDIGGQDTKAISLAEDGRVRKFEMNDRCAAGTGKFLEFMAAGFQMPVERFGSFALQGKEGLTINSMCTVFAESEATSLMAQGNDPAAIARALHVSVVKRSVSMLKRVSPNGLLVFSGGVARNRCIVELMKQEISSDLLVPEEPDMVGALGAALHAIGRSAAE